MQQCNFCGVYFDDEDPNEATFHSSVASHCDGLGGLSGDGEPIAGYFVG